MSTQTFEVQHGKMIYPVLSRLVPGDAALVEAMKRQAEEDMRLKVLTAYPGHTIIYLKAENATIKQDYIEHQDFIEGGEPRDYLIVNVAYAVAPKADSQ